MDEASIHLHASDLSLPGDADLAVAEARTLFHRTLAAWAGDLLHLRRSGLTSLRWNPGTGGPDPWSTWNAAA